MAVEKKQPEDENENKEKKEIPTIDIDLADDKPNKDFIKVREKKSNKEE